VGFEEKRVIKIGLYRVLGMQIIIGIMNFFMVLKVIEKEKRENIGLSFDFEVEKFLAKIIFTWRL